MTRFSANLGFLWQELSLPDGIRAAKAAGFDAVECHYPYDTPAEAVRRALEETGLAMLGLNTARGNVAAGDNGLAAIPGREEEARLLIDQAIDYADAIGARNVHVMAGKTAGDDARATFISNLRYACERASKMGATILIEPLNYRDAPGYFLQTADQALDIIVEVGADNLKLMFDCYHLQIMQGDLTHRLQAHMGAIGHIQIAAVPDRREPDHGEIDYRHILQVLEMLGYDRPIGAEYRPATTTNAGLTWLQTYR
ncbi:MULTISPECIES: TIM barrel protein [Rhizobium]|nr:MULTISPECIES: TIM barrel protein [Rhizobium]MBB3285492.1 hydroxypyruvate isomerase [Rhizobium sp. BK252]MBB3400232.1 hydroxypyruvate isomerase [Rhizobium sp. BK289]MBB3412811.1 hydroxypyruvate isomerase [Rhizobium sp. BK284]MBB3480698.1 hydroxypyruvate isomerase [Rhizobium sp. BK347]MDK4719356.1 TIM barrel protein [Rhizobium sp. CNPSo 3968]